MEAATTTAKSSLEEPFPRRRMNLKKASVDDLRRLYEERLSTAEALRRAELARRGSASGPGDVRLCFQNPLSISRRQTYIPTSEIFNTTATARKRIGRRPKQPVYHNNAQGITADFEQPPQFKADNADADFRSNKPPVTDAKILAMVLLRASKALTFAEIIYHIFKQFAYFGMMAARDSASGGSPKLALRFGDALRFYDLPLTTSKHGTKWYYKMQKLAGFTFLRHFIDESPAYNPVAERYSLLRNLPPELRLTIYNRRERLGRMARRLSDPHARPYLLHAAPIQQILALLLVNRGIHAEAKHLFYQLNRFHCLSTRELRDFLAHIHPLRLRYVRHVYHEMHLNFANRIFDKLLNVTGLRELCLHINEEALAAMQRRDGAFPVLDGSGGCRES
ncbi:hypothetical protein B0A55_06935 [Friedmanniomyces simplex]|uniref:Uncharacterized protein n=1 Tax=Friedmanniomyces simplex TaxID=329884 RepID=A0A4V5NFF2_9PEZI|nr:hypothetical protein B0A55_06935 [Friedmanniomyces simplex]